MDGSWAKPACAIVEWQYRYFEESLRHAGTEYFRHRLLVGRIYQEEAARFRHSANGECNSDASASVLVYPGTSTI